MSSAGDFYPSKPLTDILSLESDHLHQVQCHVVYMESNIWYEMQRYSENLHQFV
jgi:hypothetical protein